jgi:hypothetical protein
MIMAASAMIGMSLLPVFELGEDETTKRLTLR